MWGKNIPHPSCTGSAAYVAVSALRDFKNSIGTKGCIQLAPTALAALRAPSNHWPDMRNEKKVEQKVIFMRTIDKTRQKDSDTRAR